MNITDAADYISFEAHENARKVDRKLLAEQRATIEQLEAKVKAYEGGCLHDILVAQAQKIARLENGLGCSRSHPHEDMNQICELRTEVARLNNELSQRTNLEGSAPCWNSAHMKQIATLREALKFYSGPGVPFDEDYETRDYEDGSSRGVIVKFGKVARQALKETTK